MAIKNNPVSPRQKMINLMYVVLMAMLALNVSQDVLKGFDLVGDSLERTIKNAEKENRALYDDLATQFKGNPAKVRPWFDKAQAVKAAADSLNAMAERLKLAIARETDGAEGDPRNLRNKEDLEAASTVMLAPVSQRGKKLFNAINGYRNFILNFVTDPRQRDIINSNLSTDVPRTTDNLGKKWENYMFEAMPSVAAITMLSKLQSDVRKAENEVLHTLAANIGIKDVRVNELSAYVIPETTTLYPGEEFRSRIFMAAVDTTQRPEVYVNGRRIGADGRYNFSVGGPGEYTFGGYINITNAEGNVIKRDFVQRYKVVPRPVSGATVAADLMNVLYAGYDNPISVSAAGVSADKVQLSMSGGNLTPKGNGRYVARPSAVGQDVTFTVSGALDGKQQTMGSFTFKVRKLPDPTAFITIGGDSFRGGKLAKGAIVGAQSIGAAIDDGLLNIPFRVLSFECVFFDRMGNVIPRKSGSAQFTEDQRNIIRSLARGNRFYIDNIRAVGPDGVERTLTGALGVTIN